MNENCYRGTVVIGSRYVKWIDVRVHLAMKFPVGVKIRRKDDTLDKLNVCGTQKIPHGMPLSISRNGAARISLEVSNATSSIFHFCGTLVFFIVFYIVSCAIAQMIDREKKCGNVTATLKIFVCIIRLWTRYELKKLKGWSIVAVANDVLILFEIVLSYTCKQVSSKFSLIF